MESSDLPPAKRRRTTNDVQDVSCGGSRPYIVLARVTYGLLLESSQRSKAFQDSGTIANVTLKSTGVPKVGLAEPAITLTISRKSVPGFVPFEADTGTNLANSVLRHAVLLPNIIRNESDDLYVELAGYRATLGLPNNTDSEKYPLTVEILWRNSAEPPSKVTAAHLDILKSYWPPIHELNSESPEPWSPSDFYDSVHVPEKTAKASAEIKIDLLDCGLYPFQRRAVRWLLSREGMKLDKDDKVIHCPPLAPDTVPDLFHPAYDADGNKVYMSGSLGVVSDALEKVHNNYSRVKGGILAEEMGLGKTVELIALICLHRRQRSAAPEVSGATLIITPPALIEQWKQELIAHAPSLKVHHYQPQHTSLRAKGKNQVNAKGLSEYDVVLTTYHVLSKEIHYVRGRPNRNMRHEQKYEPPKSPLTEVGWWRVCLDEAQNVESGVSAAAEVARLVPRVHAWAVTGTPLRRDHKDLYGLMRFLHMNPWGQSQQIWNTHLYYYKNSFRRMIGSFAIRHSKENVREDLRLPPQMRHTITVPFTAIEEQHYGQLFYQMCDDCGVDRAGAPLTDDWDPGHPRVIEKMRMWLTRLRQTCLHPEVGGRNRRALGRSGNAPLRTVLEVLHVMIDQNEASIRAEERFNLLSRARRGQMCENAKLTPRALLLWQEGHGKASEIVEECRRQIIEELNMRKDASLTEESVEDQDGDGRLTTLRQRLRSALEVQHIFIFFIGNGFFQLKTNEEEVDPAAKEYSRFQEQEEKAYEAAKKIRSELLSTVLQRATKYMDHIKRQVQEDTLAKLPEMKLDLDYSGIESRKIFEKLHSFCKAMNHQAVQFTSWRQKMIDLLQQSLLDEDDAELKGDEYEASTKHQDEMYVYMEMLRALYADRADALSGQTNMLIAHEMKVALASARKDEGPAPKQMLTLLAERVAGRIPAELGSLRGIVGDVRALITSLQWQEGGGSERARAELSIAEGILKYVQKIANEQSKAVTKLEQEVEHFRETMNNRLEYYRALQKISDTVAPFEEEEVGKPLKDEVFGTMMEEERAREVKIANLRSKKRYLEHLKAEQSSAEKDTTPRTCVICQCDFENGTLTVCGHQFCKDCIRLWYNEHRTCPECRRHLKGGDFYDITYKPAELIVEEEVALSPGRTQSPESPEGSTTQSIYSDVSATTLNQIKNIDLEGSSQYGTKVDTMCRQLLWLRQHDPGCKVILFSQYREFLGVLEKAFAQHKIACTSFDKPHGIEKFKADPAIECFLLHAQAHATGLNLVVASHVILCEPLINTAIELQAIARVHRIGQQRATVVWMYLVADTVEESIYEISVQRRLAHIKGKNRGDKSGTATPNVISETALDAANTLELQSVDLSRLLTTKGGEIVAQDDMWQCMFGKAKRKELGFSTTIETVEDTAGQEVARFIRAEAALARQTHA